MSRSLKTFLREAPRSFCPQETCNPDECRYKYYACGKGCTLGILFEDSVNVYFEWLTEKGSRVEYGPHLRYRFWPKREFARLLSEGVWEPVAQAAV